MDSILHSSSGRRAARRPVMSRCCAVSLSDFRTLGTQIFDVSPYGLLVACDGPVELHEKVFVSFRVPGEAKWFDADAEVVRVVRGHRPGDPGPSVGLRFTSIRLADRLAIHDRLRGLPPVLPARPLRRDYAAEVRRIAAN